MAEKKEQKIISYIVPAKQYVMDAIKYWHRGDSPLEVLQRALYELNNAIDTFYGE